MNKLTAEECTAILDRYRNWNLSQKSPSNAFCGIRTTEDDILDERRELILNVTKRLRELSEKR